MLKQTVLKLKGALGMIGFKPLIKTVMETAATLLILIPLKMKNLKTKTSIPQLES
jgi:hypothetical protein